jgi:Flp pilus assembly protein TadG
MRRTRHGRTESGQALAEIALSLPFLLIIVLGLIEFGRIAYFSIALQNAAEAGAQYGAEASSLSPDFTAIKQAAIYDGQNVPGLSVTASRACYCISSGAQNSAPNCSGGDCSGGSRLIQYIQVDTSATVNCMLNYYVFPSSFNLAGHANLRVSQ